MAIRDFLTKNIPLPSAEELDSLNHEIYSPFPEISFSENRPTMSLSWFRNVFSRSKELSEKLHSRSSSYARASSDLESLASTDASTLLEEDKPQAKRRAGVDARVVSDAIIGLSDGLTVPFALTAGLSALGDARVVIFGGTAELIAGAISMGLGGYLGAKSEE